MLFAMIRQAGPGWDVSRSMRAQDGWPEHVEFMNGLEEAGLVVLAGPLGDGTPVYRAMLIFDADSERTVRARVEADPWTTLGVLTTVSVDRWEVLVGELPPARPATDTHRPTPPGRT
jgi:uncharacterized protein